MKARASIKLLALHFLVMLYSGFALWYFSDGTDYNLGRTKK